MPTRVVPDPCDVAVGARLDMAAQRGGPTLHDGACGSADVGRERMRLLVGWKRVLEDGPNPTLMSPAANSFSVAVTSTSVK